MPARLSTAELLAVRLAAHRLEPPRDGAADATAIVGLVQHFGAMQAQDYPAALWAVGARLPGATAAGVEAALADGALVRSWPMRGTLHLLAGSDLRWMLRLLAGRQQTSERTRRGQLGLEESDVGRAAEIVTGQLAGGRRVTRRDLYAALDDAGLASAGQRGVHLLGELARQGLVCVGRREGTQPTFGLVEELIPPGPLDDLPRDDALVEVARRYLRAHAPAAAEDLAWWTGLPVSVARTSIAALGAEVTAVEHAGRELWMPAGTVVPRAAPGRTHLLAGFDEFVLGYRVRSPVVTGAELARVLPGGNGVFLATVVSGGRVVGLWRRRVAAGRVGVDVEPFVPGRALPTAAAARRLAAFLQLPAAGRPAG